MDDKKEYSAVSTIKGIISTGRLKLLFKPHLIILNVEEMKIIINSPKTHVIFCDDITGIDLYYSHYCADMDIETTKKRFKIKCLGIDSAQEIKDVLNSYIWEKMH